MEFADNAGVAQRTKDKVCIIGCSDSRLAAPYHAKDEYEFWGVNNLFTSLSDVSMFTRWFEIHQILLNNGHWERRDQPDFRGLKIERYLEYLAALNIPVYMQQVNPLVPKSIEFPSRQIVECLGGYFTNSISWQIALAICEGFKQIELWGIDMSHDTEYGGQRPSCEYFLGVAAGRGINVYLPDTSDLLKARFLYAIEEHKELPFRKRMVDMVKGMEQRKAQSEHKMLSEQKKFYEYAGAIGAARQIDQIYKNVTGG